MYNQKLSDEEILINHFSSTDLGLLGLMYRAGFIPEEQVIRLLIIYFDLSVIPTKRGVSFLPVIKKMLEENKVDMGKIR